MSKASNLAGFVTSISPVNNLNVGIVTATAIYANNVIGSSQIGVSSASTYLGLSTQFNFVGAGFSVAYNSTVGISTVTLVSSSAVDLGTVYYFANT